MRHQPGRAHRMRSARYPKGWAMNPQLKQRLKALGASDQKITSLEALGFSDATIGELLDQLEHTEKEAAARGIRYKESTTMGHNADYDRLDTAYTLLDQIKGRLGMPASIAAAEAAVTTLRDLESGRATVERDGVRYKATYKAAGDPFGGLGQRFLSLLSEAGDVDARAWLEGAIAELEGGDQADAEQTVTKSAPLVTRTVPNDPIAIAFQGPLTGAGRDL